MPWTPGGKRGGYPPYQPGGRGGRGPWLGGHGPPNPPVEPGEDLRPVLHHQGRGEGDRFGPVHLLWYHTQNWGRDQREQRRGDGSGVPYPGSPTQDRRRNSDLTFLSGDPQGWRTVGKGELRMAMAVVMLVDDEVPCVETMTKRLTKRNLAILSAFSGAEALEKLKTQKKVDVVVLDVKMPGMDGIETLREIKRAHPLVEVVMLTGHATVETAIEGMKLGAFDYLMKPCEVEMLMDKVGGAAPRRRGASPTAPQAGLRRGHPGPQDGGHGRDRGPEGFQEDGPRLAGDHAHRSRHRDGRPRGIGNGGLRLSHEALRSGGTGEEDPGCLPALRWGRWRRFGSIWWMTRR